MATVSQGSSPSIWSRIGGWVNPFDGPTQNQRTYEQTKSIPGSTYGIFPSTGARDQAFNTVNRGITDIVKPQSPTQNTTMTRTATTTDPYAQWGGQDAYNSLLSGFNTQKDTIYNSAMSAAGNQRIGLGLSIQDFLDSLRTGQSNIDRTGKQAELGKITGMRGILDMVGRGVRSGGVMLANRNAGSSSAAQGIANAYGQIGRQSAGKLGNEYALKQDEIGNMQQALGTQRASGIRNIQGSKDQVINQIVTSAEQQLAQLDAQMADASISDRFSIEQEKERIRQGALGQLSELDGMLAKNSEIQPTSRDQLQVQARDLANAGTETGTAFDYSVDAPVEFQNTGPFASSFPIFTFPSGRRRV